MCFKCCWQSSFKLSLVLISSLKLSQALFLTSFETHMQNLKTFKNPWTGQVRLILKSRNSKSPKLEKKESEQTDLKTLHIISWIVVFPFYKAVMLSWWSFSVTLRVGSEKFYLSSSISSTKIFLQGWNYKWQMKEDS